MKPKTELKIKLLAGIFLIVGLTLVVKEIKKTRDIFAPAAGTPANFIITANMPQNQIDGALWRNFCQGGEEAQDMIAPVADKVAELKPQYIRIDHIFDFYHLLQPDGNFYFADLDQVVFSIQKTGAIPFFSLSYIPESLSLDGKVTSPPKDWSVWENMVTSLIEHYSGKNSLNINNVYYEVYNEPDFFGQWRYNGDPNYLDLYTHAALAIQKAQNVNPFRLGGPATTGFYPNWIKALLDLCAEKNLPLDFISWHRYSLSVDDYQADFESLTNLLTGRPRFQHLERLITEFGPGPEKSDFYESAAGAAHSLAVSINLVNKIHRIFAFEIKDGPGATFPQWGLLTHESKGASPKPRWQAYQMLNRMAGKQLPLEGNGSWVSGLATQDGRQILFLAVNYDQNQEHSEYAPLRINNLVPGKYRVNIDFLFGPDTSFEKEVKEQTFFYQIFLPANEAALITLQPITE